ncbi:MAG: hypothetical protein ACT4NY_26925 [Pseudonocardiales bacterium]
MTAVDQSSQTAPITTQKTTTRKKLRILCVVLLIVTTVVFLTSLWVFQKVHGTVETVRTSMAPAIIGVLATRAALVAADNAAINSFATGQAQLTGPGDEYQSQIAIASRSLAQAAGDNAAGEDGSQRIQLVEGLLVSYQGLIGHADANFRENEGSILGTTDLWYASHLLHIKEESGILFQLNMLLEDQKSALDRQLSASSMTVVKAVLVWVPIVVLFVVLGATQIFLKRRFRRTLNPPLLLATVLLVGLSVVMSLTVISQHRLQDSRANLQQLVDDWGTQISVADAGGQRDLRDIVTRDCVQGEGECGVTVTQFVADLEFEPMDQATVEIDVSDMITEVNLQIAAAGRYADLDILIYLTTGLIAVLILLGLLPRIGEYRYRPR